MLVPERVDVVAVVALRLRDAVRCDACDACAGIDHSTLVWNRGEHHHSIG